MKQVVYYLVSPANLWVKRLQARTAEAALQAKKFMSEYGNMPDVCICTNECATTFSNGLRFSAGKLYHV